MGTFNACNVREGGRLEEVANYAQSKVYILGVQEHRRVHNEIKF